MPTALTAPGIAEQWLFSVLGSDPPMLALATGGVFSTVAPQGSNYPLLIFAYLGGADVNALGPNRVLSNLRYGLSAYIDTPSIVALDAIMARADALLQGKAAVTAGGYILAAQRLAPPAVLGVPDAGISYRRMQAIYQLQVEEGHGGG